MPPLPPVVHRSLRVAGGAAAVVVVGTLALASAVRPPATTAHWQARVLAPPAAVVQHAGSLTPAAVGAADAAVLSAPGSATWSPLPASTRAAAPPAAARSAVAPPRPTSSPPASGRTPPPSRTPPPVHRPPRTSPPPRPSPRPTAPPSRRPTPPPTRSPTPAPTGPVVWPGTFCWPPGARGVSSGGRPEVCGTTPLSPFLPIWHPA